MSSQSLRRSTLAVAVWTAPKTLWALTDALVKRDREKQEENLVSKDFLNSRLDEMKEKQAKADAAEPVEYVESDQFKEAKERLADNPSNSNIDYFSPPPTSAKRQHNHLLKAMQMLLNLTIRVELLLLT